MTILATMFKKKDGSFQNKYAKLTIKQQSGSKGMQTIGQIEMDLANYCQADGGLHTLQLPLVKCSDKKAVLKLTLQCKWLQQLGEIDDDTGTLLSEILLFIACCSVSARRRRQRAAQRQPRDRRQRAAG